jgi:hypothetical protein
MDAFNMHRLRESTSEHDMVNPPSDVNYDIKEEWYDEAFEEHLLKKGSRYGEDEHSRKKKFIFRMVLALHASGNISYKTEEYTRMIAKAYGLHCSCAILPVSVMITFHDSSTKLSPHTSESYSLRFALVAMFKLLILASSCECEREFPELVPDGIITGFEC